MLLDIKHLIFFYILSFAVTDAFLEDDILEQCQHLLRTKTQEEVEWDGSGIGKWHRQEGCHDNCPHDNQNTSGSPQLKKVTSEQKSSYSPDKKVDCKEDSPFKKNSPYNSKLSDNVEDYSWDSQFDDLDFCEGCRQVDEVVKCDENSDTFKKSAKDKIKEVFQKSKEFIRSKVKKLPLFQSSNLMKGDNSMNVADKGNNSCLNVDTKTSNAESLHKDGESEILSIKSAEETLSKNNTEAIKTGPQRNNVDENNGNLSEALGWTTSVKEVHSSGDVNGNLSEETTCTNANGHLRSDEQRKTEAIKMPGLINTSDKGDNSVKEEPSQLEALEYEDIEPSDGKPVKPDRDEIQIKVENDEDIPLGTEANHYQSPVANLNNGNLDYLHVGQAFDKRLSWLFGSTEQNSFNSEISQNTATSNSSDKSLDMILMERTEDPERILTDLGFAGTFEEQNKLNRIPDRFLSHPSSAEGIDLQTLFEDDEDLGQILQAMAEREDNMDSAGTGSPHFGGNPFSYVMSGMRFASAFRHTQNPFTSTPMASTENKDMDQENMPGHQSILHPMNRDWLAKQGFYEKINAPAPQKSNSKSSTAKLTKSVSTDAAERRKRFHQSRSTKHMSLTDVQESEENQSESRDSSSLTSEFQFRSFATSVDMSCDSFDSSESPIYSSPGRGSYRRNDSLIDDEDTPYIQNELATSNQLDSKEKTKIGSIRKTEVEKLMSLEMDDGDYVLSPQSSLERTLTWQQLHGMSEKSNTLTENGDEDDVKVFDDSKAKEMDSHFKVIVSTEDNTDANHNDIIVREENIAPRSATGVESSGTKKQLTVGDSLDGNEVSVLGNIGRMESIHSDSSGFVEPDMMGDHLNHDVLTQHRILNLSPMSSAESDQTYKSGTTVLPNPNQPVSPRFMITSPCDFHSDLQYIPEFFHNDSSQTEAQQRAQMSDKAVGTDDLSQLRSNSECLTNHTDVPMVTYHMHSQDIGDSGNETVSENNSLTLTIDLPKEWVKSSNRENVVKKRVVSHFYKHITPPSSKNFKSVVNIETKSQTSNNADEEVLQKRLSYEPSRELKPKWTSTPSATKNIPVRSSTPYERSNIPPKKSLFPKDTERLGYLSPGESTSSDPIPGFTKFKDWHYRCLNKSTESELSDSSYVSRCDSSSSLRDENIDYLKLMRLINKPVSFKRSTRGTKASMRFKPKYNIKAWTHLERKQHLVEETRLAQYALQRYKTELNVLETTFLVNSQLVKDELIPEERDEIEEFQLILSEVRKEIVEMEHLLANRIGGLNVGNDNFSPLLLLDIIQKMTDLLKEQIFQQQVSIDKDSDDESEQAFQPTHQTPWWPEVSEQLYDIQKMVSKPHEVQLDKGLNDSLQELRSSILTEVKQELHDNTKWLQKELQHKDRELNRLRMEVMSDSLKKGHTRRKQYYESDV